ncbi:MAG: hypothetical protein FWC95_02845 [Defluviitaleaceae bacterium]|nr:hypothetical protein [Defluviitaleaceae bacterium]
MPPDNFTETLSLRALTLSDMHYDQGLAHANDGNISAAVSALRTAVYFDKYNISARTLLGLCLYRLGRLGCAMEEWHISAGTKGIGNPAESYIESIVENPRYSDKINQSLENYNTALDFFRKRSLDMGIVRLKKAIELNPTFIDALNLLALGYIQTNKADHALPYLQKALAVDASNKTSLAYYAAASSAADKTAVRDGTLVDAEGYAKKENKRVVAQDFYISEIVTFLITAFLTAVVFLVLIVPDRESNLRGELSDLSNHLIQTREVNQVTIRDRDTTIQNLEEQLEVYAERLDLLERIEELTHAQILLSQGERGQALSRLQNLQTHGFSDEQLEFYYSLMTEAGAFE